MLLNIEQYVNHSDARWVLLEYMGKLTNGINMNEYVLYILTQISQSIFADRNIRIRGCSVTLALLTA